MGDRSILDFGFCGSRSGGSLQIERDKTGFWIEKLLTPHTPHTPHLS
jgi:hypothetical protein